MLKLLSRTKKRLRLFPNTQLRFQPALVRENGGNELATLTTVTMGGCWERLKRIPALVGFESSGEIWR